jgi:predicted DNA-binding transcriptional regulator YafY
MGMLLQLQARGQLRAEDLARRFEVSVRTVYRDLQALSETGVPIVATPGKGYRLMPGYFLPPLSFTAPEAALLALGAQVLQERVDPELRRAAGDVLLKLTAVLPAHTRAAVERWRRELQFYPLRATGDDPRLAELRAAIAERRVVRLVYHARGRPAPEPRDVEPVSLVCLGEIWNVAAYCRLRAAPRLFRLDRIDALEVLAERFELGDRHAVGPDGDPWLERAPEVRVRFDPGVVRWVRERQPFFFRREEDDPAGPIFVYAWRDDAGLLAWILGWGAAAEVLDPPEFRRRLRRELLAMLARHGESGAGAE